MEKLEKINSNSYGLWETAQKQEITNSFYLEFDENSYSENN